MRELRYSAKIICWHIGVSSLFVYLLWTKKQCLMPLTLTSSLISFTYLAGVNLSGLTYQHPLKLDSVQPLLGANFVSTDKGTGLVHIAPAHGPEDFLLGLKNNISIVITFFGIDEIDPFSLNFYGYTMPSAECIFYQTKLAVYCQRKLK